VFFSGTLSTNFESDYNDINFYSNLITENLSVTNESQFFNYTIDIENLGLSRLSWINYSYVLTDLNLQDNCDGFESDVNYTLFYGNEILSPLEEFNINAGNSSIIIEMVVVPYACEISSVLSVEINSVE